MLSMGFIVGMAVRAANVETNWRIVLVPRQVSLLGLSHSDEAENLS